MRYRPAVRGETITDLPEISVNYPQQSFDETVFPPARKRLSPAASVLHAGAAEYEARRDFPATEGTSRLSACLALGALSPRQCLHRLLAEQPQALDGVRAQCG